jgi:hypothetical protein
MSDITNGKVTGDKRLNRVGATPLFGGESAQKFREVAPTLTFAEKRAARQRGIGTLLTIQKSYEILANYGCFARKFATNAESYSVLLVSLGTTNRKCTALVNAGVIHRHRSGRPWRWKTTCRCACRMDHSGVVKKRSTVPQKTVKT